MFNEGSGGTKQQNRNVTLKYMDDYVADLAIMKTNIESLSRSIKKTSDIYFRAYPYAIDAVPLQFGSNQVTQLTVQFSYMRHYTLNNDIQNIEGDLFLEWILRYSLGASHFVR